MVMTRIEPTTPRHFERSEAESRNLLSERFPMVMKRSSPTPPPSFRAQRSGVEKSPAWRVSYGCGTQRPHDAHVISSAAKRSREISCLKGFLWWWHAVVPCRTGNHSLKVSYGDETQWSHAGQETVCQKFPMVMTRSGASFRQETIRKGFPMAVTGYEPMPDRKLYENKNPLHDGEDFL